MATKTKTTSHTSLFVSSSVGRDSLDKFIDGFNESYNHLYITSNWKDLKNFINDSLLSFETITLSDYSRKAENFLVNNFNILSKINSSINVGYSLDLQLHSKELLYSNIVLNLILTSNVKVHNHESEFGIPNLDLLVLRYHTYTTLYLCLVDICIKLYEFDSAVEKLVELGIVQYYLRRDIRDVVHGSKRSMLQDTEQDYKEVYKLLDSNGIYLHTSEESSEAMYVINHVIEYWKNQTDLEVWSRLVKIFLSIDSIYNCLNEIESLPLSMRLKIFFSVNFVFCDKQLRKFTQVDQKKYSELSTEVVEDEYEDVRFVDFGAGEYSVYGYLTDKKTLNEIMERISRKHIISHIFSCNFNFQCFFIEGLLLFCHLCKDFYHDVFSLVYSILFDVLQIFISINCYYHYYKKKEIANKLVYGCLNFFKLYFKHFSFIPPILQLVCNRYRLEKTMEGVEPESLMPMFIRKSSVLRKFSDPILGFSKISSLLKSDLEYNFLFQSLNTLNFNPLYYEHFTIVPNSTTNSSREPVEFNLNFNEFDGFLLSKSRRKFRKSVTFDSSKYSRQSESPWNSLNNDSYENHGTNEQLAHAHLGSLSINGIEISNFTKSQDVYNHIHFLRSIYNSQSRVKIKNIKTTKYSSSDYRLSFRLSDQYNWLIRKFPDSILSVIIASCFLIDDIYIFIHYSQSLEYLQYKDTLKSKNRAIIQTLLPFVPKRSTKDAKKILSFQKHIKKKFKDNLMSSKNFIPFIPNLKKTYRSISRLFLKSDPKPSCDICVKTNKDPESVISFKVSSVRRKDRHTLSMFGAKKLMNPLLSSRKASYGQSYSLYDFRNSRSNRRSISRYNSNLTTFLNSYSTGENIDNNRFFGSVSKCIHLSLGSSFKECDFCNKLNNFKHLSHLMYLIDLLSHYLFTLNLSCSLDFSLNCKNKIRRALVAISQFEDNNDYYITSQHLAANFGEIMKQIDKSFYLKSCSYYNKNEYPYKILKELIENTVLLSLSTVFHEDYYNHLLSRLSIYHLIKGRFNIALSLINQTLAESNTYKIDYGASDSHLRENYLCDLDRTFKVQLASKIYLELLNDVYSFRNLNKVDYVDNFDNEHLNSKSSKDKESKKKEKENLEKDKDKHKDKEDKKKDKESKENKKKKGKENKDNKYKEEEYYRNYRVCLMSGYSYLKEAPSKFMNSLSILDTSFRKMVCSFFSTQYQVCFFPKLQGDDPFEYNSKDDYKSTMKLATETLFTSVRLDPQDYKAWYYLAKCSLYSNDLHFAFKCCQKSIECFDSCIASWLTMVICNSTRVRTCAGFYVDEETWKTYILNKSFEDTVSFKSIPSPLEPMFPPTISSVDDLDLHLNRHVGDDLDNCLLTLKSLQKFDNIYMSSCIFQLVARLHKSYNSFFPWEQGYLSQYSPRNNPNLFHRYNTPVSYSTRSDKTSGEFAHHVKKMVTSSIESNYLICVVPFMNLVIKTFFRNQFDLKCRHHSNKLYAYNSSGLSIDFMEEELYGWLTCIEILCQIGETEVAQLLLPILDLYFEYYSIDKYYKKKSEKNVCKISYANKNKRKLVQRFFGQEPFLSTDIVLEIRYINFYTKCYNTTGTKECLRDLLEEVTKLNAKYNYRKFALLKNRLLAGVRLYNQSVQMGNQLHRMSLKISGYTDYDLEYKSLLAFAHSLRMIGEREKWEKVDTFATQLYLTSPVLKLDLCLNVPL